ncbi:polysaccharide deacetylase family protein [Streptomyces litchfieldiae]|uniref:Polysaccharide deacetylase family protein n=1 Tax=Streptomyces litchfieldiae TaxID=3075543 RepID=A0ABU2MXN6_9ACTN|nr:polysaccharide deacetylase family protein [Streptomyces sp. DSM 44938]MDT0346137.1 polysaccharide deacetylase family protein [Streptomyces sp. DSM 44938]
MRRVRRCTALGGATMLALVCSGAGLPPHLLPGGARSPGTPVTADANPPGTGDSALLASVGFLGAPRHGQARAVAEARAAYAERLEKAEARRVAAAKRWGLRRVPLRAPAPPEKKPKLTTEPGHISGAGLPPVIVSVPTDKKVVFLTIDDGSEKDPRMLEMLRELDVPYSSFLADYVARDDYGYFRKAHRYGSAIQNHSVNHREMPKLTYAQQRTEICRQQDTLEKEIGERPEMFRPPYGAYDRDTLRAAASCGVRVVPLWAEEAFPDRIAYGRADRKFHPGDIILTHFRGKEEWDGDMIGMLRRVLNTVTEQGFAIARLEDYV